MFKKPNLQTKEKEYRKEKVKDNAEDLFNELYYIYNESYTEGKSGLNTIDIQKFDYKNCDSLMIMSTSLKRKKKKHKVIKNLIKKSHLKN